ncbi:MAG: hypothetical protein R3C03_24130 [Pirellulaceae bacterium]
MRLAIALILILLVGCDSASKTNSGAVQPAVLDPDQAYVDKIDGMAVPSSESEHDVADTSESDRDELFDEVMNYFSTSWSEYHKTRR